jgi:flagellar motility protein MotE (MotC chaperone)
MTRRGSLFRSGLILLSLAASAAPAQEAPELLTGDPAGEALEVCEGTDALFLAISRERDLIDTQRADLERDLDRLELVRESVRQETARLAELRDEIQGVLQGLTASGEAEIQSLVNVYETMKPDEAAALLDGLDMSITMVIFSAMSERRAAPILARMNPVRAQAISRILVEMTKLPEDRNFEGIRLR